MAALLSILDIQSVYAGEVTSSLFSNPALRGLGKRDSTTNTLDIPFQTTVSLEDAIWYIRTRFDACVVVQFSETLFSELLNWNPTATHQHRYLDTDGRHANTQYYLHLG